MWATGGDDDDDGSLKEPGNPRAARICTIIMQRRVENEKDRPAAGAGGVVAEDEKQIGPGGGKERV